MKPIKAQQDEITASFKIAIITSEFNQDITQALQAGALSRLREKGIADADICVINVPGAVEIPLVAQKLAQKNQVEVIIALGAVVRGETTHYETVCQMVAQGCQQVSLSFGIPVIFGVLTTENDAQAWNRLGGAHGHKGVDAADCALQMRSILKQLA